MMDLTANGVIIKLNGGEANLLYNELELVRRQLGADTWNRMIMEAIFDHLDKAGIDGSGS